MGSSTGSGSLAMLGRAQDQVEKVWLVISVVTWREETSSRMFCVSGSENGPGPR